MINNHLIILFRNLHSHHYQFQIFKEIIKNQLKNLLNQIILQKRLMKNLIHKK